MTALRLNGLRNVEDGTILGFSIRAGGYFAADTKLTAEAAGELVTRVVGSVCVRKVTTQDLWLNQPQNNHVPRSVMEHYLNIRARKYAVPALRPAGWRMGVSDGSLGPTSHAANVATRGPIGLPGWSADRFEDERRELTA